MVYLAELLVVMTVGLKIVRICAGNEAEFSKSKVIIFAARGKRGNSADLPPPSMNIERVSSLRVLGVIVNDQLSAADHVTNVGYWRRATVFYML